MNVLHTWHPDPTLLNLGGFTIHWYGLMLAFGATAGYFLILRLAKKHGLDQRHVGNMFVLLVVVGLIGARLYHVLNEPSYYSKNPGEILAIWNGGLAIHGAIIAGGLAVWWYCRRHKLNLLTTLDLLVPGLAIGQAIGRWGNYFNQELFGRPTELPWGIPIDPINRPQTYRASEFFHPTFLYESVGSLIITIILLRLLGLKLRPGMVMLGYTILYSFLRITTEIFRIDRTPMIAGIRLPILVSSAMIVVAVLAIAFLSRQSREQR